MKKLAHATIFEQYLQVAAGDIGHAYEADIRKNTQKLVINTRLGYLRTYAYVSLERDIRIYASAFAN